MDRRAFVSLYGPVYEHSPWIAGRAHDIGAGAMHGDADALARLFEAVIMDAGREQQLSLLRAHPELACGTAAHADLTPSSKGEQERAGLDRCTPEEFEEFRTLNSAYRGKFGFPFIIAVRGLGRREILERFRARLSNDANAEFHEALRQVCRIGCLRIGDILDA